jgi:ATP-dependent Clp protease ATP-binding subunit ClpC
VARIVGEGDELTTGQISITPRVRLGFGLAEREARALGHSAIDSEHLLLGLAQENEGVASIILRDLGADGETICRKVIGALTEPGDEA